MEYRILGPLEVVHADNPVALAGAKQRALLAMLLLNANRVVSSDQLIDALWSDAPPETAAEGGAGATSPSCARCSIGRERLTETKARC